jgi:pyruvate/2-oxoacid:ferredoxin oxidoreductase alpha subunit
MEMRRDLQDAMEAAKDELEKIDAAFHSVFGRRYGAVEAVHCDDADIIFVTSGTITSTCRLVVEKLRAQGERVGLLKMRLFRPFPYEMLKERVLRARKLAVVDRNFSFGASGIFAQEIRAALCNEPRRPLVFGYVAGLGGRDVTPDVLEEIYWTTKTTPSPDSESSWVGLQQPAPAA